MKQRVVEGGVGGVGNEPQIQIKPGLAAKGAEGARGVGAVTNGEGIGFGAGVEARDEAALNGREEK